MEKTTKKKRKSKRLKRRIGLIAVGGLSLVLTVCLSVGATLAWFAGSTWASKDLYMGGPVYVEMAGRGNSSGVTPGNGTTEANWTGGDGKLDIVASGRTSGTASGQNASSNILLPGQKLLIYSQARVFSTAYSSDTDAGQYDNLSSGANTTNISNGSAKYTDGTGRVRTTTTSVLRAKFSINVEFDPYMGFNNFTDVDYAANYPKQSQTYTGEFGVKLDADAVAALGTPTTTRLVGDYNLVSNLPAGPVADEDDKTDYAWNTALDASSLGVAGGRRDAVVSTKTIVDNKGTPDTDDDVTTYQQEWAGVSYADGTHKATVGGLAVWDATLNSGAGGINTSNVISDRTTLDAIKSGALKSIYKWKYVSATEYNAADNLNFAKMAKPFDGTINSAGGNSANVASGSGNGFYGVWVLDGAGNLTESDAFYKARTTAYMNSYKEHYRDEYNRNLILTVTNSLNSLETALNNSFVKLVNESSDNILAGNVDGFTVDPSTGAITPNVASSSSIPATWLYVDPSIGNDTNASDSSTSVGGWWYLVQADPASVDGGTAASPNYGSVLTNTNKVVTTIDNVLVGTGSSAKSALAVDEDGDGEFDDGKDTYLTKLNSTTGVVDYNYTNVPAGAYNKPIISTDAEASISSFSRYKATTNETGIKDTQKSILNAKLYEITPNIAAEVLRTYTPSGKTAEAAGATTYDGDVVKIVSVSFPFVNGDFELPGRELTNIFANAKITFHISFQALQAFFPFANSIDGIVSGSPLTGTAKALNIQNSLPIFNEAFDYLTVL